jgi:hypothetical protein
MDKSKFLLGVVAIVYALYVYFQLQNEIVVSNALRSFILPTIALLYFLTVKRKSLYFTLFLVIYAVSDLLMVFEPYISNKVNYYLGNSLYIIAYSCLLLEVCKSVCVFRVVKNFKIHIIVLSILNVYILYVLHVIVDPRLGDTNQLYIEIVYNVVMLLALSLALVNYFYRDNVKSLYVFLGSMCLVFSEVIWVAYIYISASIFLNILSTSLYVIAFYFFYRQAQLFNSSRSEEMSILTQ